MVKLVNTTDLKSVGFKAFPVQVRVSSPIFQNSKCCMYSEAEILAADGLKIG